jgi:hypothetical protein
MPFAVNIPVSVLVKLSIPDLVQRHCAQLDQWPGLIIDGLCRFRAPAAPFMAFGLFMALSGLFGHTPIADSVPFDELEHRLHSLLATLAGVSITAGLAWHALRTPRRGQRAAALALAVLCVVLPLSMLNFPAYQGLIQRVMYLLVFAWLWHFYPRLIADRPRYVA